MPREPFPKVIIAFEIETCKECPFVKVERTPGAGFAVDYYCGETGNKVMGYVEWSSDENPVPTTCPKLAENAMPADLKAIKESLLPD